METPLVIVVGGGIGGAAAALRAVQYHIPIVWIQGDGKTQKSSRVAYVKNIDNMIGVHPGIVQDKVVSLLEAEHPEAAAKIRQAHFHISTQDIVDNTRARIKTQYEPWCRSVNERAVEAQRDAGLFRVRVDSGAEFTAPFVVLSTGVADRQPVIHKKKGERALAGIHWIFPYANEETTLYCIRCEGHLVAGRRVAVLGAGEAAAEISLMLRERYNSEVTLLTAGEPASWSDERGRLLTLEEVRVVPGKITNIRGGERGATLKGFMVEDDTCIEADQALVVMGLYQVYNGLACSLGAALEESPGPDDEKHVLVNVRSESSVRGLFVVGDMATHGDSPVMKQVYTAQEYAVRAVDTIDRRRRRGHRKELLAEDR